MAEESEKPRRRPRNRYGESKMVIDRIRLASDLRASLKAHEGQIREMWGELLEPHLEDGEPLDLRPLLRAMARLIQDRIDRLSQADEVHRRELDQDHGLRVEQRRWAGELRHQLVDLRGLVQAMYGRPAVTELLGLRGPTARDLVGLQRLGNRVVERLRDPEAVWPEPGPGRGPLDRELWSRKVEAPVRELERAEKALAADHGVTESAFVQRSNDQERYDREVHAAARWLNATYELIGFEQAKKDLLPETRKRRRVSRAREEIPAPEPEPGEPSVGSGSPAPGSVAQEGNSGG